VRRLFASWRYGDEIANPIVRHGAMLLVLVYAFSYLTFPDVGSAAQSLVAAAGLAVLALSSRAGAARVPLIMLGLAIAVQVASWYFAPDVFPEFVEEHPKIDRLARWFLFMVFALWLGGSTRRVMLLWCVALAGFLLAPWITGGGWAEWARGISGRRVDFGVHNAQHTAVMFGAGLLGLTVFFGRVVLERRHMALRFVAWMIPLVACLVGIVVTQTRGIWLSLAAGLLVVVLLTAMVVWRGHGLRWSGKAMLFGAGLFMATVTVSLLLFSGHITERVGEERETIEEILAGDFKDVPFDSAGIRFHSWAAATDWIEQRPWLGWGKNGSAIAIKHSQELPESMKARFGHLHSSYLDVLVQHGVAGLAILLGLFGWLAYISFVSWRAGYMAGDVFVFAGGFLVYWLIANVFESFMFYSTGRFLFNIVAIGIFVHYAAYCAARGRGETPALSAGWPDPTAGGR
jgi:O-antigen ligase